MTARPVCAVQLLAALQQDIPYRRTVVTSYSVDLPARDQHFGHELPLWVRVVSANHFNAAQFWITVALAVAVTTGFTYPFARSYLRRNPSVRFGPVSTTILLTLISLFFFVAFGRLALCAFT
jgi:hypothetical protein